ncbi:MAG: sodium-dependent transporter [Sphaerochaetaceae bacterium]|jgi:neurotransmitter:Na+ symporter, NSS family|nr:sodium-dependent transporter [Sphaerochaetaceae bacterium]NLY06872.1 sodium-dependent transporter [Spirochaetales bacterium]
MSEEKGSFSGKVGFVLAAAGSAVGLGNIWRFPYLAANQGGGIYILTYVILVVFVGFALSLTETALGRRTGKSTLKAFGALDRKSGWMGVLPALVPAIILPYYSVVGGWVVKYLGSYLTFNGAELISDSFFGSFISSPYSPLIGFALFFVVTSVIVSFGVQKGIEKASRFMMPILVVLCIGVAIYTLTLPGAMEGMKYLFVPNFSQFSFKTLFSAMSQMFYSLSLAMGIMVTYGTYMKKDVKMDTAIAQVAVFDTAIAILAAVMVVPGVFVFSGGNPEALNKGAGLMFVTLPKVFASIPGGDFVGILFFVLVLFAALTSSISLMEAIISELMEIKQMSRRKACVIVSIYSLALGSLASLGFGPLSFIKLVGFTIFDFMDFASNNVMMPVAALIICIFTAWIIKPETFIDEVKLSSTFKVQKIYSVVIKYVAPVLILLVLITSVMEGLGLISY